MINFIFLHNYINISVIENFSIEKNSIFYDIIYV